MGPQGEEDLDLAGLVTVCDMVPLVGENRHLARAGLAALARTERPGLRALMALADLEPGDLDARSASFRLGPCVVIALDGEGGGRGSGRSVSAYDLHAGLDAASAHLRGFGGHAMAAGLEIDAAAVEGFRAALAAHAGSCLAPEDLVAVERVDAVVSGAALTLELAEELERLGPFGAANPAPTLLVPAARIEHVTAVGAERRHARFSLVSGGARARGVAFGVTQAALAREGGAPRDVAVALERERWRGAVRGSVRLRATSPTAPGRVRGIGVRGFWEALEHELRCDPGEWWPVGGESWPAAEGESWPAAEGESWAAAGESWTAAEGESWAPAAAPPGAGAGSTRALRDRRGEGLSGVAGELLTSGEPTLVVVADLERRRATLEERVAGMAAGALLPAICWADLGADPAAAAGYTHLLVLDPPPVPEGLELLASGEGGAHLAWGEAERAFALACWRAELDLRPPLAELWRALRAAAGPVGGEALERALRGSDPRGGACAGRLLRVLGELGLARWDPDARTVEAMPGAHRALEQSAASRAYAARLTAAQRHLGGEEETGEPPPTAQRHLGGDEEAGEPPPAAQRAAAGGRL